MNELKPRIDCWFSCGAPSAYATKLAIAKYEPLGHEVVPVYCDTSATEHPDNTRFRRDCEKWFGREIKVIKSMKYDSVDEVFLQTKYLVGIKGARCTTEMKKVPRFAWQTYWDIHVFGYTAEESTRIEKLKQNNPELEIDFILFENGITRADCLQAIADAGIELPMMYRLGYKNNNCIGCVKGQVGYWNKIRKDFPERFQQMAQIERTLNVAINKTYKGGKRQRVFLDELPENAGRYETEPSISCGIQCDPPEQADSDLFEVDADNTELIKIYEDLEIKVI